MRTSTQTDPRSIVTPDAFEVSAVLLGRPLATPGRRLGALLIDLAVIGLITAVTRSFALVLGVVAAAFFMRAGFKRTEVRGSVFGRAMRLSVGCLGFFIAVTTALVWTSCGGDFSGSPDAERGDPVASAAGSRVVSALARAGVTAALDDATTLQEAETEARAFVTVGREAGLEDDVIRGVLEGSVPEDAAWAADADALFDRLLSTEEERVEEDPVDAEVAAEVAELPLEDALAEYAEGLRRDADGSDVRREALSRRIAAAVAADTLEALSDRVESLERTRTAQAAELDETRDQLREATSGGLFGWLREFVDELGFGFGWASLYLTVFLSWWNGQTIGKKMLGLRVMRLDGEPITWWVAFERAGGYAAGLATGLLGFAQVYWDANRQAIHDRIVGTVVVVDGAEPVADWKDAL